MSLLLALLSTATVLTGGVAQSTTTALDGVIAAGSVTTSGAQGDTTTTALDGVATPGAATLAGEVAGSSTTALDGSVLAGSVTLAGTVTASTTTALDGTAQPGAVTLSGEVAGSTTTALAALAIPGAVTLTTTVAQSTTTALDGVAGYPGPDADVYSLSLSIATRTLDGAAVARGLALSLVTRALDGSAVVRFLSTSTQTRSLVSVSRGIVKGDSETVSFTLSVDTGTIASPVSGVLNLYVLGSATPEASLTFTVDSGAGTSSLAGHVDFTAANTPAVGSYVAQVVLTYVDGPKTWPSNANGWTFVVRSPGALA